jgi:hypothetical protein
MLKPLGNPAANGIKFFATEDEGTKEINEEARRAGAALIKAAQKERRKTFVIVNNRLEGNALETIKAMLDIVELASE